MITDRIHAVRFRTAAVLLLGCAMMVDASLAGEAGELRNLNVVNAVPNERQLRGRTGGTVGFGGRGKPFGGGKDKETKEEEEKEKEGGESEWEDEESQGYEDIGVANKEDEDVDVITSETPAETSEPTEEELMAAAAMQHEVVSGASVPEVTVVVEAKEDKKVEPSKPEGSAASGPMSMSGNGKNKVDFVVVSSTSAINDGKPMEGVQSDTFISYEEIPVIDDSDEEGEEEGVMTVKPGKSVAGVVYQEIEDKGKIAPADSKPLDASASPLSTVEGPVDVLDVEEESKEKKAKRKPLVEGAQDEHSDRQLRGRTGGTVGFGGRGKPFGGGKDKESKEEEEEKEGGESEWEEEESQGYEDIGVANKEEEVDVITSETPAETSEPTEEELMAAAAMQHEVVSGASVPEVTVVVEAKEEKKVEPSKPEGSVGGPMSMSGNGKNKVDFVVVSSTSAINDGKPMEGVQSDTFISYEEIPVIDDSDEDQDEEGVMTVKPGKSVAGVVYQDIEDKGKVAPADAKPLDASASPLSTVEGPVDVLDVVKEEPEEEKSASKPSSGGYSPLASSTISSSVMGDGNDKANSAKDLGLALASEMNFQDHMENELEGEVTEDGVQGASKDDHVAGKISLALWTMSLMAILALVATRKFRKDARLQDDSLRMLHELDMSDDLSVSKPDPAFCVIDDAISRIAPMADSRSPKVEEAMRNMERARDLLRESQSENASINPDVPRFD